MLNIHNGEFTPRNIKVSSRTDPVQLAHALQPLLNRSSSFNVKSFGSEHWILDREQDAITRYFAFEDHHSFLQFQKAVREGADAMNHHPDILPSEPCPPAGNVYHVTVSCCTHKPPGLSMKDVQLAHKIDEIASSFGTLAGHFEKASEGLLKGSLKNKVRKYKGRTSAMLRNMRKDGVRCSSDPREDYAKPADKEPGNIETADVSTRALNSEHL